MEGEDMRTILRAMAATAACVITLSVSGLATDAADAAEPGLESQYVAAVNQVRANAGLPPLAVHGELTGVARGWADTMASANEIWHNPNLGSAVSAPWLKLGENVGTGYDVAVVMDAFVNSPAHYRNLVDP
ncbi:MAG TPA: CAP domain-containing protein, partial [Acidimicrobiales bacterium]|nr:CAP domain-containing protein [Acidimicrobiales bacterium]